MARYGWRLEHASDAATVPKWRNVHTRRSRTHKPSRAAEFESALYANSSTAAGHHYSRAYTRPMTTARGRRQSRFIGYPIDSLLAVVPERRTRPRPTAAALNAAAIR